MTKSALTINPTADCVAHAKLNLTLQVLGRRDDGYHLLDGITVFCEFGDRLHIMALGGGDRLSMTGPFARHVGETNIVLEALDRYRVAAGWPPAINILLEKHIPVAAGLGGGSADAAALIRWLQARAPDRLEAWEVASLAQALGADVAACLESRPVRVQGAGEILCAIADAAPTLLVVLANPRLAVPTASVFARLAGSVAAPVEERSWRDLVESMVGRKNRRLRNDLIPAACLEAPVVTDVLDQIESTPGVLMSGMSGSGATCFGLFDPNSRDLADHLVLECRARGWWAIRTRLRTPSTDCLADPAG